MGLQEKSAIRLPLACPPSPNACDHRLRSGCDLSRVHAVLEGRRSFQQPGSAPAASRGSDLHQRLRLLAMRVRERRLPGTCCLPHPLRLMRMRQPPNSGARAAHRPTAKHRTHRPQMGAPDQLQPAGQPAASPQQSSHDKAHAFATARLRPWLQDTSGPATHSAVTVNISLPLPPTKRFIYIPTSHPLFNSPPALRSQTQLYSHESPSKRSRIYNSNDPDVQQLGRNDILAATATLTARSLGLASPDRNAPTQQSKNDPAIRSPQDTSISMQDADGIQPREMLSKHPHSTLKPQSPERRLLKQDTTNNSTEFDVVPKHKRLSMWDVDADDMSITSSVPPKNDRDTIPVQAKARPSAGAQPAQARAPSQSSQQSNGTSGRKHSNAIQPDQRNNGTAASRNVNSTTSALDSGTNTSKLATPPLTNLSKLTGEARKKKKIKLRKDHRYLSKQALLPAIDSKNVICADSRPYVFLGDESRRISDDLNFETIVLEYPGDNAREIFPFVIPARNPQIEYNPINDIYVTTQAVAQYCMNETQASLLGNSRSGIIRNIMKACHRRDPSTLQSAISDYNQVISQLREQGAFEQNEIRGPPAPYELVTHILEQAYARSVAPFSHQLNNYQGFSNNVYGEIKHSFVHDLIKQADIQPHHIFLDMGSGIGNVVLQVAAECLCESYGIEIMETPSDFAKKQRAEFLSRMRYYAKPCGRIVLRQGNFLEDDEIQDVISRADVIFVNNYAFDATLNQGILAKFLDLKESAKVISLRSFVPVDRRPNLRRSNAIESIFRVKEYHFARDSVSWMVEGGNYYIHTVDRRQLASVGA